MVKLLVFFQLVFFDDIVNVVYCRYDVTTDVVVSYCCC